MVLFFYNLGLLGALVLGAPWWLWRMATTHKYREGLGERLGRIPHRLRLDRRPVLWVHAVSVGEVLAVSRLIQELDRALPAYQLVVSTTTRTGQDLARQRFGAHRVFYCPLDLRWAVRAWRNALCPRLLLLVETELWPNLLTACFRKGIPVAVVNARISDRSWPRYLRLRRLWAPMLARLDRVLAQSAIDAERLRALGCRPERVSVAGNLKFDVRAAEPAEATAILSSARLRILVAGSTLEGEESALLAAWAALRAAHSDLAMVLAPRHPERFATVAALLAASGQDWIRRSDWKSAPSVPAAHPLRAGQILLLDTIGELASVYSLASVAFVGGSLIPSGGHNPLEPAQFAIPTVIGPHYANFRAITESLLAAQALRIATAETLAATLDDLLQHPDAAQAMGERARQVFEQQSGATARCVDAIQALLRDKQVPASVHMDVQV